MNDLIIYLQTVLGQNDKLAPPSVLIGLHVCGMKSQHLKNIIKFITHHKFMMNMRNFTDSSSSCSSRSGHPVHPYRGQLRRGPRHRHTHSQDRSNRSCGREGRRVHTPHQQRHHLRWRPGEKPGRSQSGRFERADGFSHAGEERKQ